MSTQTESLAITSANGETRRQQILDALFMRPAMSRSQLAEVTGMRLSSVCGRVNELLEDGKLIVAGKVFDRVTERNVETLTTAK
jgi:predicted transcriptional regulator